MENKTETVCKLKLSLNGINTTKGNLSQDRIGGKKWTLFVLARGNSLYLVLKLTEEMHCGQPYLFYFSHH